MSETRKTVKREAVPVRVAPGQRQRLKVLAAKTGKTLQEITSEVVEDGLKKRGA